jgi:hypothetical protein
MGNNPISLSQISRIGINLGWINPWFATPFLLLGIDSYLLSLNKLIIAFLLLLVATISTFYNENFYCFINYMLLAFWPIARPGWHNSLRPTLFVPLLFIFIGLVVAILITILTGERVGLYGGEPNFSGFILILFFVICLARGEYVKWIFLLALLGLLSSLSRTFMLALCVLPIFYYLRRKKILIISILFFLIIGYIFFGFFVHQFGHFSLFKSCGYESELKRLVMLNDSSTRNRILLNEQWLSCLDANKYNGWIGIDVSIVSRLKTNIIGKVAHNSYIQKAVNYGIFYVLILLIFMIRYLPFWIAATLMFYAFFLHSLLSVPCMMIVDFYLLSSVSVHHSTYKKRKLSYAFGPKNVKKIYVFCKP